MDIEYTFWQMLHLCTAPKVVYQHTKYHKQTKNQWARDDPAFVVICSLLLAVATVAYCAALYAFDVHCNSFFPMFVMLYASYYHYLNFLGYDGSEIRSR
ncbi:UNC-50 family protein [Corchorus olitorius]|uniref:UNC-50 family protein n=1 Tax=Corchorus olitorius TaxID=93759 RepID=A0A1R3GZ45_9ROSI|nr:UNC-50 family protein [Corchorus olitorius]